MRGSIQKKGKSYYVVLPLGKKRKWIAAGSTMHGAERVLNEEVSHFQKRPYRNLKKTSFKEFAIKWLQEYAKGKVKESTFESYEQIFKTHLIPFFGNYPLNVIIPEQVQEYVSLKKNEGKISSKTINNTLIPLKEMFKHAVRWNYLHESPALYVEKPRVQRKEMNFLNKEEIEKFLKEVPEEYYTLFLMDFLTGLRRGELLATKWNNLDLIRKQYFVKESLYKNQFAEPKSVRSKRAVDIGPILLDALQKHYVKAQAEKAIHQDYQDMDLIFCQKNGKPLDPDNLVKRVFLPSLRKAGIRQIRFHDIRHTFAALLCSLNAHPKYIQNQMGHASIQTTLDLYGHLMPEIHQETAIRLQDSLFEKSVNEQQPTTIKTVLFPKFH